MFTQYLTECGVWQKYGSSVCVSHQLQDAPVLSDERPSFLLAPA